MAADSAIYPVDLHDDGAMKYPAVPAKLGPRSDFELPPPATYSQAAAAAAKRRNRVRASRRGGGICCCLLSSLCGFLVAATVVLGIAALIIWLILRPIKAPRYSVEDVQIQDFNFTPGVGENDQSNILNSTISLTIQANNPNKKIGIIYDSITTTTYFDDNDLGSAVIPGFYQGHRNITTVTTLLRIDNYALPSSEAAALTTDMNNNNVPLEIRTSVKARVKIGSFKSFAFWVHVTCHVNVEPRATTQHSAGISGKSCKVTR